MTCILTLNAQIKDYATVLLVNANASLVTKESLVRELFVPITAMTEALAGLKNI